MCYYRTLLSLSVAWHPARRPRGPLANTRKSIREEGREVKSAVTCVLDTHRLHSVFSSIMRNWKIVNQKRKERWNNEDQAGKYHMLEESELNRKAKILQELMAFDGSIYKLNINGIQMSNASIMRLLEWGLEAQWGIKVQLIKFPGIRFKKLDGCSMIIDDNDPKIRAKLGLITDQAAAKISTMHKALDIIKAEHPELVSLIESIRAKESK